MTTRSFVQRFTSVLQVIALSASLAFPLTVRAAEDDIVLELRPHCDSEDVEDQNGFGGPSPSVIGMTVPTDGSCSSYPVKDPTSRQTGVLKVEDELDMDLVILNPKNKRISRVSARIAYDPTILEGEDVELSSKFGVPTPGENDFDEDNAVITIGASASSSQDADVIRVARIRMKVIDAPADQTVLSFDELSSSADAGTAVISGEGAQETNLLPSTLRSLVVRLESDAQDDSSSSGASQVSSVAVSSRPVTPPAQTSSSSSLAAPLPEASSSSQDSAPASSAASSTPSAGTSAFTLLQVQNLRATTEGGSVFLAWDALESSELRGYNVYYGTTSGKYIQRRTIDSSSTNLTIRNLTVGTTYYFAVRAVNSKNQESQFSREVGITVGSPETSTNPLAASAITDNGPQGIPPNNDGTISGESGPASLLVIVLGACAAIGTVLAFKRQFIANS